MKELYNMIYKITTEGCKKSVSVESPITNYGDMPKPKVVMCENDFYPITDINLIHKIIENGIELPFVYCEYPQKTTFKKAKMMSVVELDEYKKDHGEII